MVPLTNNREVFIGANGNWSDFAEDFDVTFTVSPQLPAGTYYLFVEYFSYLSGQTVYNNPASQGGARWASPASRAGIA